jgi:hypothetical protein
MAPLNARQDSDDAMVELIGARDAVTTELVERLAKEDFLGQLLRKDGLAGELGMESGRPQLDWVDGIEKALARPDLLAGIEEEAAAALRSGHRRLIWSGMGGSVQTIHALKRLGFLDSERVTVHPLDSTDPALINKTLREIAQLEGIELPPPGGDPAAIAAGIKATLKRTMMIAVAMGMTSEEPITHVTWFWDLMGELGIEQPESHVRAIALEGSYLDNYARDHNVPSFPLMPEGRCNTAGRMSAPVTRVFMWPAAWTMVSAALAADPTAVMKGDLLSAVLRRAQQLFGVSKQQSEEQRREWALKDPFLRLGAFIAKEDASSRRNKVLLLLPPGWQGMDLWIEQVVEESLGKKGKGFMIFYGQDVAALATHRKDCMVLRIGQADKPLPALPAQVEGSGTPVLSLKVPVVPCDGAPLGLGEVGGLFANIEKLVAVFAYVRGIIFAGQPAVEAYKKYARELRDGGKDITNPPESPWIARSGSLAVHYSSLVKTGLISEAEATALPSAPAALLVDLLRSADRKGWLGYLDLTYNGEKNDELKSLFADIRDGLANNSLHVPAKLRTGPQDYHSTEQGETDGPAEITSLRFVCTEHEPVMAGRYTDRFLMAQAYGTWQAMEDAHRWVIMITLSSAESAAAELKLLFSQVGAMLAHR